MRVNVITVYAVRWRFSTRTIYIITALYIVFTSTLSYSSTSRCYTVNRALEHIAFVFIDNKNINLNCYLCFSPRTVTYHASSWNIFIHFTRTLEYPNQVCLKLILQSEPSTRALDIMNSFCSYKSFSPLYVIHHQKLRALKNSTSVTW